MESSVLNYLKFEMTAPTPKCFLRQVNVCDDVLAMLSVSLSYITNELLILICRSHCIGDLFVLLKAPPIRALMRFHQCSWNACPTSLPNYLF